MADTLSIGHKHSLIEYRPATILRLAWPMIVSQVAVVLMQLADLWMLSLLGSEARQAVGTAANISLSVGLFGAGFLTVVNALVGHAHGAGKTRESTSLAWQGIWAACLLGFGVLVLHPAAPYIFAMIGHSPQVQSLETAFFKVGLLSILPQLIGFALGQYFIATGRPLVFMAGLFLSVVCNMVFNYGLIFGQLGFPKLGFVGAAYGTLLANSAMAILMFSCFWFQPNSKRMGARDLCWSKLDLEEMFRVGVPAGIQDCVEWGTFGLLLMFLANKFGPEHLEASSILLRCIQMAVLPADGVGSAVMALVANQIGARRHADAMAIGKTGFRIIAIYMCLLSIGFYAFREEILGTFTQDADVILIGSQIMVCICLFQVFDALTINYIHCLQGAGDSAWPSMVNLTLVIVVMLGGGSVVLSRLPQLESFGIWSLAALLTGLQGVAFWLRWESGVWRKIRLRSHQDF